MNSTLEYYEANAGAFVARSVGANMGAIYERFLQGLPEGASLLDAGCGSGRDAKVFRSLGYPVDAFDGSAEVSRLASEHCGLDVKTMLFSEVTGKDCYDGVWACASLLHLPLKELGDALARLWRTVRPGGCMYMSFKYGDAERVADGRHFTDLDVCTGTDLLLALPNVFGVESWLSPAQLGRRGPWLNLIARRTAIQTPCNSAD